MALAGGVAAFLGAVAVIRMAGVAAIAGGRAWLRAGSGLVRSGWRTWGRGSAPVAFVAALAAVLVTTLLIEGDSPNA